MKIIITGATGFIGKNLVSKLLSDAHQITVVGRDKNKIKKIFGDSVAAITWDGLPTLSAENFDNVIHLAGENIGEKRWSDAVKQTIISSRVNTTKKIVEWCLQAKKKFPHVYLASAIGIYGLPDDAATIFNEKTPIHFGTSHDFLSEVGQAWEEAAQPLVDANFQVTFMRFAVVLKRQEGMLKKLELPFSLGLGSILGSGKQSLSWIQIDDLISAIIFLMHNPSITGAVNMVAPEVVTQQQFAHELAKVLHRPLFLTMPKTMVTLLFGEMGKELLLSGQHVIPQRLNAAGFAFDYPTLTSALTHEWSK